MFICLRAAFWLCFYAATGLFEEPTPESAFREKEGEAPSFGLFSIFWTILLSSCTGTEIHLCEAYINFSKSFRGWKHVIGAVGVLHKAQSKPERIQHVLITSHDVLQEGRPRALRGVLAGISLPRSEIYYSPHERLTVIPQSSSACRSQLLFPHRRNKCNQHSSFRRTLHMPPAF